MSPSPDSTGSLPADPVSAPPTSEQHYRRLFEASPQPMWVYDLATLRFLEVNDAAIRDYGYSREEFRAITLRDIRPVEDVPVLEQKVRTTPPGYARSGPWRHRRKDGSEFVVEITSHETVVDGRPARLVLAIDVTNRLQAEAALRESEARYRLLAENTHDVIWLFDLASNRFTYVSPSVEKLRGFTPAEIATQSMQAVLSPESYRMVEVALPARLAAFAGGDESARRQLHEVDQVHKDGSLVPTEVATTLLTDAGGRVTQILGVSRNITARRQAEIALGEGRANLSGIIEAAADSIALQEADGRLVTLNAGSAERFGRPVAELIGRNAYDFFPPAVAASRRAQVDRAIATGQVVQFEDERNGRHFEHTVNPVRREGMPISRVAIFSREITARKKAEIFARTQYELAAALATTNELSAGLHLCLEAALRVGGLDGGGFYLLDESSGALELRVHHGLSPGFIQAVSHYAAGTPQVAHVRSGNIIYARYGDLVATPSEAERQEGLRFFAAIPFLHEGRVIGCLNVASHTLDDLDSDARKCLETIVLSASHAIVRLRTEKVLHEERQRLEAIISGSELGTWECNLQTGQTLLNERWARIVGYTLAELAPVTNDTWNRLVHPDDFKVSRNLIEKHFRGELASYSCEVRMRHKEGHWVWVLDRGKVTAWAEDGKPLWMQGVHHDITDQKRQQSYRVMSHDILLALSEPEDLHTSIQRVLGILKASTEMDAVGLRLQEGDDFPYFCHEGFAAGFIQEENSIIRRTKGGGVCRDATGNLCLQCTCGLVISGRTDPAHPLGSPGGSAWTNDSFAQLEIPADQDPRTNPRNQCAHAGFASVALVPVRAKGRIIGLLQLNDRRKGRFTPEAVAVLEDVARNIGEALLRRQAEMSVVASEARYRSLFENRHAIMLIVNPEDGAIVDANPAAAAYYGWTVEELRRMRITEINCVSPSELQAELVQARKGHRNYFLFRHRRADGTIRDVEVFSGPIVLGERRLLYSIVHDITERVEAQAAVTAQLAELRRWHTATVGRETRVLELKQEINRLLAAAGQPPRYASVAAASTAEQAP